MYGGESPIYDIDHTFPQQRQLLSAEDIIDLLRKPCQSAIVSTVIDTIFFVIGIRGLDTANEERVARALLRELGEDTIRGFERAIVAFHEASDRWNKAYALYSLLSDIYNKGGFKSLWKALKGEMNWWEWVKASVTFTAQVAAWFASDGLAFVGEIALRVMSAEKLIEDALNVKEYCSRTSRF